MRKQWPDARLVPLVDFVAERHIAPEALPVDYHRITRTNAFVISSRRQNQEVLLLRDDACWKIDSDAQP